MSGPPRSMMLACALAAALPALAAKSPPPPATIGDLSAQSVQVTPGAAPAGGPARAMENYRQFLQMSNADPKLRAEALRRLGDLNLESGELERMASEVTRLDLAGAEAIRLYTMLLQAYPQYPRNDQVLYQLARAYDTTGQQAQSLATLDAIVARYPNSRDIPEVQFRRGEILFSTHQYAQAQAAYEAVLARGQTGSGFYAQSLYKLGWSEFKQGLSEQSLESFGKLLDLTLLDPHDAMRMRPWESLGRADRELAEDTLRVMSITFSNQEGARSLDEFIARRPSLPPYAWMLYSRLGDLYVDKQRYQDAASTYRAFVSRDPVDEHAPALSMAAIEAYRKGGFADLMLQGKLEYVERYGFDAPFWKGRQRSAYPQVIAQLKSNLRDVAQYYHATAQKTGNAEDYAAAARWYRSYLASFPDDPDSAATNYLLADALFESHQYLEAAGEYERTAYDYPRNARSAEAAHAALVSYQKYQDSVGPDARAAIRQRVADASLKFAQTFPEHPDSPVVLTQAAQDLYAAKDQARAAQVAQALLARNPPATPAQQRIGWTIIGQVHFNQGEYAQAETAFTHALALASPKDPERADINDRLAASIYKQADARRAAGDQAGAARDFLRVGQVAAGSKISATAQYDAAAALISAQQWDQAISVLEAYRHDYPQSQYAEDVERKLAVAYEQGGHTAQAAAQYERIAANPHEDRGVAREAMLKAADLYARAGDDARGTAMLEKFVRDYPTPVADAIEARQRLLEAAIRSGNVDRQHYWEREIVQADAAAGAARTERTRYLAARAQLALAEPARDAFRAVKLVVPLKRSLLAKKKAMESAIAAYKRVAEYQVAETTTAATYETAELYRVLAQDLLSSERPKKLSADEKAQYDALLEDQAYPFEEQAIALYEVNAKRAAQGVYDDSVRRSFEALAKLDPARYGKVEHSDSWVATLARPGGDPPDAGAEAAYQRLRPPTASDTTEAQLQLQQFALEHPGFAAPDIDLGLLARSQGKLADSEAALRRASTIEPKDALAWSELGVTLRLEGKFKEAQQAYETAIAADADYAPAHRNLAVLLDLYLDQPAAALPEFERYQALSGEDKPVKSWIAELRTRLKVKPAPDHAEPATGTPAGEGAAAPGGTPPGADTPADASVVSQAPGGGT